MIEISSYIAWIIVLFASITLLIYGFDSKNKKASHIYFGLFVLATITFTLHLMAHMYDLHDKLAWIIKIEYAMYMFMPPLLSYASSEIFQTKHFENTKMNLFLAVAAVISAAILFSNNLFESHDGVLIKLKLTYSLIFLAYYAASIALAIFALKRFRQETKADFNSSESRPFFLLNASTILVSCSIFTLEVIHQIDYVGEAAHYISEVFTILFILFMFYIVFKYELVKIGKSIYVFLIVTVSLLIIAGLLSSTRSTEDEMNTLLIKEAKNRQSEIISYVEEKIVEFFEETYNSMISIEKSLSFEEYLKNPTTEVKHYLSLRLDETAEHNKFSICFIDKTNKNSVCSNGFDELEKNNLTRIVLAELNGEISNHLSEDMIYEDRISADRLSAKSLYDSDNYRISKPFVEDKHTLVYIRKPVEKKGLVIGQFIIKKDIVVFEKEFEEREISPNTQTWLVDENGFVMTHSESSLKFKNINEAHDGQRWINDSIDVIADELGVALVVNREEVRVGGRTWHLGIGTPLEDITSNANNMISGIRNSSITVIILIFGISAITITVYIRHNLSLKSEIDKKKVALQESEREIHNYAEHLEQNNMELNKKIGELEKTKKAIMNLLKDIKDSNEKLKSLDNMKTEFMNVSSHELKTPLISIIGYSELLQEKNLDDESKKMLSIIWRNSQRLKKLVTDIITISKLESGDIIRKDAEFNLKDVADEVLDEVRSVAKQKNISLIANVEKIIFNADRNLINQLFANLLNNAIKFTPNEGKVTFELKEENDEIIGLVSDTGVGIPKDKIDNLFQKFYQVDSSRDRKYGGSGLGLSICKKVVLIYGGKIVVESVENQGTTFKFTIPKKQ